MWLWCSFRKKLNLELLLLVKELDLELELLLLLLKELDLELELLLLLLKELDLERLLLLTELELLSLYEWEKELCSCALEF